MFQILLKDVYVIWYKDYPSFLHMGNLPFIAKEDSLIYYVSDVRLNTHISSYDAFLWSLREHIPDVARMIFHYGEVEYTSYLQVS